MWLGFMSMLLDAARIRVCAPASAASVRAPASAASVRAPASAASVRAPASAASVRAPASAAYRDDHNHRSGVRLSADAAGTSATSLGQFLMRLAVDPPALSAFIHDPAAVMDQFDLDESGRAALNRRSEAAMWNLLLGRTTGNYAEISSDSSVSNVSAPESGGSLIVVGTGIRTVGHLTAEAIAWIRESDTVLYLVADPVAEEAIRYLNPHGALSLRGYYGEGIVRTQSYEAMVQHITSCVQAGQKTCVALYGHPGVFAYPAHEAIRRLREEGFPARMLPAISAEDCLFADLGVDPAVNGCQSIEASDFLVHEKTIDTSAALVLWQIGVVGDWTYRTEGYRLDAFPLLISRLADLYGGSHTCIVYEAAVLPGLAPKIIPIAIESLTAAYVTAGSTLYVPPNRPKTLNRKVAMKLGIIT